MLDAKIIENCSLCESYSNEIAKKIDIAFQLWKQGYITDEISKDLQWNENEVSLKDKYIFINRFYKKYWSFVVLIFRLLEFNNPFAEILSFCQTRKIKKVQSNYSFDYEVENSLTNVLNYKPLISVIIPTLNRYKYLKDVLLDLEKQTFKSFEVIVFDQSEPYNLEFYQNWNIDLKVVNQKEKALWLARNSAIKMSKGDFILMSEDDVRFDSDFILKHLQCISYFKADISCGVFYPKGSKIPESRSFFKYAEQFATGNALLNREVFAKIGLFDRQFEKQRMGDGEFGMRCYLNGFKMVSNPFAFCIDVKAPDGGLRQNGGSWDAWRPKNFFAPRPIPSVLYYIRKYFKNAAAFREIVISVFPSIIPYRFKRNKNMLILGLIIGIILSPILIISVLRSWRLASIKLNQGEIIERL
jgi:glycosyltransferase involved in cell wall biosynthesis